MPKPTSAAHPKFRSFTWSLADRMQFALLKDGLCSIHDCKPTVCALFPLGRVVVNAQALESGLENGPVEVKYMLVDTDCGSRMRVNTVREWLARFGIPEHDEFFLLWSKLTAMLQIGRAHV